MIPKILQGLKGYQHAFGLLWKLGLWKYFAIPILICFFTAVTIAFAAWTLSGSLGSAIALAWIWDWGASTAQTISTVLGGLIIIVLGLIVYKHIVMALSAPFMSPVSEKIEAHLYQGVHQHRITSNTSQLMRGIKVNLRNLCWELLLTLPILLLGLIPVIGILSTVILLLVQAYYAGFGNMDYTLERHYGFRDSVNFVKKHRGAAIGNGIIFILILFIPLLGIILVLPLSVTAASVSTLQLMKR